MPVCGGWTGKQLSLAFMMLVTGSINTLTTKWADRSSSEGYDGKVRPFDHPFLQACGMFLGEMSCLAVYFIVRCCKRNNEERPKFNPLIFLPPAACDMCGTSLMYIGLNMTYASSFQMLRGAVIIFTALLSVAFLRRVVKPYMWAGMLIVIVGLVIVGISDFISGSGETKTDTYGIIAGDLLIIMAQVIVAVQMVIEEKFIYKHDVPAMLAVGYEGLFGFLMLGLLQIPMYYIPAGKFSHDPEHRLENAIDAFIQIGNSWQVALATVGNVVSIAFFNFSGISVTKEISATTRMVLDSMRTLVIWMVTLSLGWQQFLWPQVAGFIVLLVGMALYNNIYPKQLTKCCSDTEVPSQEDERERLLQDDDQYGNKYNIQAADA